MRLIDVDKVSEYKFTRESAKSSDYMRGWNDAIDTIIDNAQTVERPRGEWIIIDDTEQFIAKCSVCGRIEDSRMVKDYPFCHCGADMRGGKE